MVSEQYRDHSSDLTLTKREREGEKGEREGSGNRAVLENNRAYIKGARML
jgi:hypothetical protein